MLILTAILENLSSRKDRTLKLTFGTQELSPDQVTQLYAALDKFIFVALKVDDFKSNEMKILSDLQSGYEENSKSQSKRIQSVLFILWNQNNEGFVDFDAYYKFKTEKYIDHLKSKIEQ